MILANLLSGLRLALFRPLNGRPFHYSWGAFWAIIGAHLALDLLLDFWMAEPPRRFQPYALPGQALIFMGVLLVAQINAWMFRDSRLQLKVPLLYLNALFWVQLTGYALFGFLLYRDTYPSHQSILTVYYGLALWQMTIALRALTLITPIQPLQRLLGGLALSGIVLLPPWYIETPRFWDTDYQAQESVPPSPSLPEPDPELVLTHQWPMLEQAWAQLKPSRPGQRDLYFVGFAGHGKQDVFMKEIFYARELFDRRFGTEGRSLALVNHPGTLTQTPLATATNLEASLRYLDRLIQPDEDVLFLFLTSHGSPDHALSVTLPPLPLSDLDAERLGRMLAASRFTRKVVVVSACYSGGFIDHLKDSGSLIITAARADRTSFGCSDDAEFTYFGRAFFAEALSQTDDLLAAFNMARIRVQEWELEQGFTPSEPQIHLGEAMQEWLLRQPLLKAATRD